MEKRNNSYLRELIRILIRNLGVLEKTEAACCGTTLSQCHAIVEIGRANQISLNGLANLLILDKSTMSRTINNLVQNDLAIRETHDEDRRYITIKLTENGQRIFQNIEDSMEIYYEEIFRSIPEGKRNQIFESLRLLTDAVKENNCCQGE